MNLLRLEKFTKAKETIIVPGAVLGTGVLNKPLNVVAMKFSRIALEKIKKAGGKCTEIENFLEDKPSVKGVRIMG